MGCGAMAREGGGGHLLMKLLFLWTSVAHSDKQPDQSHAAERTEEGQAGGGGPGIGETGPSLIGKMALGPRRAFLVLK